MAFRACLRAAAPAESPPAIVPLPGSELQASLSPIADAGPTPSADDQVEAIDESHFVLLRSWGELPEIPPPEIDIAPGAPPSPDMPAGSVYVAMEESDGTHVSEWDLARNARRRDVRLPVPTSYDNVRIQRAGGALHVLAWTYNEDIAYVRVSEDLRPGRAQWLGHVSATGPTALASDGSVTVVAFDGMLPARPSDPSLPGDPEGLFVASFDRAGRKIAQRLTQRMVRDVEESADLEDNLAVVDGHAFVLLRTKRDDTLELLRLGPTLDVERAVSFKAETELVHGDTVPAFPTVFATDGRVYVHWLNTLTMVDFSSRDLTRRRVDACKVPGLCAGLHENLALGLWVGDVHAKLKGDRHREGIQWSEPGAVPRPDPPCPPGL
jgi:hypothetical protein